MSKMQQGLVLDLRSDESLVEAAAQALYDTDEDIVDDSISARMAAGDYSWNATLYPSLSWEQIDQSLRKAYWRRALAVFAVIEHRSVQSAP